MTTLLSREQYLATFSGKNVEMESEPFNVPFVWNYVRNIPKQDYEGFEVEEDQIPYVYETGDGRFEHVFVSTKTANVFMLILLNNDEENIYGHHLLDLNEEYGIEKE
jgi:hypothetical protein